MNPLMPKSTTLRTATSTFTLLAMLPHLFCCAAPAIAAIIALGSTIGLAASLSANPFYQFVDAYHTELVILAVSSVVFSGLMNLIAYRIDCRETAKAQTESLLKGHCAHADCTPQKTTSLKLFALSCVLLALDLTWFYTEEHVLGLHHHGEVAAEHAEHPEHAGHDHE